MEKQNQMKKKKYIKSGLQKTATPTISPEPVAIHAYASLAVH